MSFQDYQDSKKLGLQDPPFYALLWAAHHAANPDVQEKIEDAWGPDMQVREFDQKFGWLLYNQGTVDTATGFLFAAIRKADSLNFEKFRAFFPQVTAEMQARYNAPGGWLSPEDGVPPVVFNAP